MGADDEVRLLKDQVRALHERLARLEGVAPPMIESEAASFGRRQLLGRLAAGAVGATAAGLVLDGAPAAAAPGFELNINNTSTGNTNLKGPGGTLPWTSPWIGNTTVLSLEATTTNQNVLAVKGSTFTNAYGTYSAANVAVVGIATSARSGSTGGRGVWGQGNANNSVGVVAEYTGSDDSGAPLLVVNRTNSAGPPAAGAHLAGEVVVRQGNLWFCTVDGTPGRWSRVTGPSVRGVGLRLIAAPTDDGSAPVDGNYVAGEAFVSHDRLWLCTAAGTPGDWMLVNPGHDSSGTFVAVVPGRVLDTRDGGTPLTQGSQLTVDMTTTTTGEALIPATASGVMFNLTITETSGGGYLAVFPAGEDWPGNSSINWTTGGQTLANSGSSRLGAAGTVSLLAGAGSTHAILDVTGYFV